MPQALVLHGYARAKLSVSIWLCSRRACKLSLPGGDERDRTDDPLLAKQVLSQLSYTPIFNLNIKAYSAVRVLFPLKKALRAFKIKQRSEEDNSVTPTLDV